VHEIRTAIPRLELQKFVRVFAQRDVFCTEEIVQADTASLEQILAFGFGDSARIDYTDGTSKVVPLIHIVGSQKAHTGVGHFVGRHLGFGIFFKPQALWQLFRIPPAEIADQNGEGTEILGKGLNTLWLQLAECRSFQERILTAERYLLPFAINATAKTLILKSAQYLYANRGSIRIEDLANHSGLSLRQYERRFVAEVGFTPKLFARIVRFQSALDIKRSAPSPSWMTVAHELGYFDQMHLVRDIQSLGGALPREILSQIGDYLPWSLAAPGHSCIVRR
jgi:AraC-like DNA-binding protein